jgi:hypothetical protein
VTEEMKDFSKDADASSADKLIAAYVKMAIAMMLVVIVGVGFLAIKMALDAPADNRKRALREATCAKNGMTLLQDKYHPAVCAFQVDEDGNRIPAKNQK